VPRNRTFSAQTIAILAALAEQPSSWRHGYDLARETGLKSGTLYPILVRLADRELVEACWEEAQPEGRPRRHLYRLSADGLAAAAEVQADQPAPAPAPAASPARPAAPRRRTSGRLAGESS
jgi:PadR family transcriptional regulator, regulatory protein PadR